MVARKYCKIRIAGGSGSGKSYLGKKISELTGISYTGLDNLRYDFSKTTKFTNRRSLKENKRLINVVLRRKKWIIDGGYFTLARKTYDDADILIFLKPGFLKRLFNTLRRFFRRFLSGKREGLFSYIQLTIKNFKFRHK